MANKCTELGKSEWVEDVKLFMDALPEEERLESTAETSSRRPSLGTTRAGRPCGSSRRDTWRPPSVPMGDPGRTTKRIPTPRSRRSSRWSWARSCWEPPSGTWELLDAASAQRMAERRALRSQRSPPTREVRREAQTRCSGLPVGRVAEQRGERARACRLLQASVDVARASRQLPRRKPFCARLPCRRSDAHGQVRTFVGPALKFEPKGRWLLPNADDGAGAGEQVSGGKRSVTHLHAGRCFVHGRLSACDGSALKLEQAGNGYYHLRTKSHEASDRCLEAAGVSPNAALGGASFMSDCAGFTGQFFRLIGGPTDRRRRPRRRHSIDW